MQTFITEHDFYKSASNLIRQHLQSTIYESIHILASLLNINDRLVNPKRSVKNHPAAKLWAGHERALLYYIDVHLDKWYNLDYKMGINWQNYNLIKTIKKIKIDCMLPKWITTQLIQTHRSVLIQKEIEKEFKLLQNEPSCFEVVKYRAWAKKFDGIKHYRSLWPDCPTNLKMRYDWQG